MAETQNPIVWDFYKPVNDANGVGSTVHYYDTTAQTIFLRDGIKTRTATIEHGDWENNLWNPMTETISTTDYSLFSIDHPSNGTLYGVAADGADLYFLRYSYGTDIGDLIKNGTWSASNENDIQQCNLTIANIKSELFDKDSTLFQPGARFVLKVALGDSDPCDIGVALADEIVFDRTGENVSASFRNKIGYYLKDTSFSSASEFSGSYSGVIGAILAFAGVDDYHIEPLTTEKNYVAEVKTAVLDALQDLCDPIEYVIAEMPSGKIVVGTQTWINSTYQATGYYQFHEGREVFKRKSRRLADAAYSKVCVTGKDANGSDLLPIVVSVPCFENWNIPAEKTYFEDAPNGFTQGELQDFADNLANRMQFTGIVESYTSPFRPQLLIGDVAQIYSDSDTEAVSIGSITGITHTFGSRGFGTTFTVDSGGIALEETDGEEEENSSIKIVTKTKNIGGYSSTQKITNLVSRVATKIILQ